MTPEGYMEDAKGALVPLTAIKPERLAEDALVKELTAAAAELSRALAAFRARAMDDVAALQDLVSEKYGATLGGRKGNVTLTSFDGSLRVRVAISETLTFGPELTAAKALIDGCITRWSEGSTAQIKALVDQAFQVNKQGRIDTQRVLGLRSLDMGGDEDWARAMDAISDAIRVSGSKTYVRFHRVDPKSGIERQIALDLANAETGPESGSESGR